MAGLPDWLDSRAAPGGGLLAAVIVGVAAVFALTLLFAAGVVVLRAAHVRARRRAVALDARWHDALLEVLAGARPAERLLDEVRPRDWLAFLEALLRFARRVRGDEAAVLRRLAAPTLRRAALETRRRAPERRARAVQILATFGMPAYADPVLAALDDPSPFVAMAAAQALASREHAEHAPRLVRRLGRFPHWSAEFLAGMLVRVGPSVAPLARELLADPRERPAARVVAAEALRRLNDPHAADVAAAALPTADDPALRTALVRLLGQVGRAEHLPTTRRLAADGSALVRAEAVRALGMLGGADEVSLVGPRLDDPSPWVAQEAARALLRLGRGDLLERAAAEAGAAAHVARQVLAEGAR